MFDRKLEKTILEAWTDDKVIICIGDRQVGKSTLIGRVVKQKQIVMKSVDVVI